MIDYAGSFVVATVVRKQHEYKPAVHVGDHLPGVSAHELEVSYFTGESNCICVTQP